MGSPSVPEPEDPPMAPPPPEPVVEDLKTPNLRKRRDSAKRGASGLTVRRRAPSINIGG